MALLAIFWFKVVQVNWNRSLTREVNLTSLLELIIMPVLLEKKTENANLKTGSS